MYLDLPELPCALHPAGYVDCVAPDVILRFPRPDYSSYHWAMINACRKKNKTVFCNKLCYVHVQNLQKEVQHVED